MVAGWILLAVTLEILCFSGVEMKEITKDFLMGRFIPSEHEEFIEIEPPYGNKIGMYLHREAYGAFCRMADSARSQGVNLVIISGARSFWHQKEIWETKWRDCPEGYDEDRCALSVLRYTSMPGTSRHHWGTEIDINSLENEYFQKGEGARVLEWLDNYAWEFGFCRPYSEKGNLRTSGHEEEKWHWSYLPLAGPFLDEYLKKITYRNLTGFEGSRTAKSLEVIRTYVEGISINCR